MTLTPELIAQGWREISEIDIALISQTAKIEFVLVADEQKKIEYRPTIENFEDFLIRLPHLRDPDRFRVLAPVTPNQVILTKEEAKIITDYHAGLDVDYDALSKANDNLIKQLKAHN